MSKFGKLVLMIVYGGLCAFEISLIKSIKRDEAYFNMVHAICDSDMLGSQKEIVLSAMPNPKKMRNSTCDAIMHICKSDMLGSQKEQAILNRIISIRKVK